MLGSGSGRCPSRGVRSGNFGKVYGRGAPVFPALTDWVYGAQKSSALLLQANNKTMGAGVLAWPEVGYTDDAGDRFHLGHAEAGRAICRYLLWPTARVDPAGQVIFCEHLRRPLGDLTAAPPGRIWNGRSARALRRYLLERGPLPVCRRCCKLVHLG